MEHEYPLLLQPIPLAEDIPRLTRGESTAVESLLEQGIITDDEATVLLDPVAQAELHARFEELGLLDDYVVLFDIDETNI